MGIVEVSRRVERRPSSPPLGRESSLAEGGGRDRDDEAIASDESCELKCSGAVSHRLSGPLLSPRHVEIRLRSHYYGFPPEE